ncbi:GNAT family N-acetyltransferase [Cupriavidus basilensis]|uniref:GNAT family N-acetyltransferase n=1 Tax=Cupriavidus basilensis TaxID=68895 RepID=UPI0005BAECF8|nr:GNAT family N-acetyltransferase [Cupriavidus basilensis]
MRSLQIRAAEEVDWPAIGEVLECCGLPSEFVDQTSCFFHVALAGERVVGCACAEQCDQTVVVRSVGVLKEYRGHQIATRLVDTVLTRARADGCTKAVLITAGRLGFSTHYDVSLGELEVMPEEVELSRAVLRRFGARGLAKLRID